MRPSLTALVPLLLMLPGAGASDCTTWSTSTTDGSQIVIDTTSNDLVVHYLAIDLCAPDCTLSTWAYREYNGIPGLQRGDEMRDDTCHGMIESDGFEF